jgi:ABC-type branched-subunit amino acid transport system substrate-binding protein
MLSERNLRWQGLGTRVLPARYEVTLKDDGCDAAKAETVAKEIVAEKFDLVLGHPCPKAALAAAKVYGAAGIAYIATETRHPDLTAKRAGPSIFRLSGRDDAQGLDAARYLAAARGGKPIAIVHDRTQYAKAIAEQAAAALKEKKIETVTATIVAGDKEYGKLVAKIKDAGAVFFAGFPLEAGFILQELRAAGSNAPFLATESVGTDEFVATFPDAAQQAFVLRPLPVTHHHSLAGGTTAVRLYAQARAVAFGPVKDAGAWVALVNRALASFHNPHAVTFDGNPMLHPALMVLKPIHQIAFDASGNANLDSYDLVRRNGTKWQPVDALR